MNQILVIQGLGMETRGKTQIDIFGPMTLAEYDQKVREFAIELRLSVEIFHSNVEQEIIDKINAAQRGGVAGALINPAGYTRGHPALVAAIAEASFPIIEVHVSNPARRGNVSEVAPACQGTVAGFGVDGYFLALQGLQRRIAAV